MTNLSPQPFEVALVQAATTLPMFLFSLPAGALADIADRRRVAGTLVPRNASDRRLASRYPTPRCRLDINLESSRTGHQLTEARHSQRSDSYFLADSNLRYLQSNLSPLAIRASLA